ncbi:MAG TPA: hypothetical protein VFY26_08640, partial [Anaerolineales bacterium]|nr:hypothetical protein [Anaerolineales bacterium]
MGFNFVIIGAGGYVVQRYLRTIQDTGNHLVAAVDPKDSVGLLDQYSACNDGSRRNPRARD